MKSDDKVYKARISVYNGRVTSEIYYEIDPTSKYLKGEKLEISVMHKTFGFFFQSESKKKDWIRAKDWTLKQLDLIASYSTSYVDYPLVLIEYRKKKLHKSLIDALKTKHHDKKRLLA